MQSFLVCKKRDTEDPFINYTHIKNSSFFSKNTRNYCQIRPYVIITDGQDILIKKTQDVLHIGWEFPVIKKRKFLFWKKFDFDKTINESIKDNFFSIWENISTYQSIPQKVTYIDKKILKEGAEYRNVGENDIYLCDSHYTVLNMENTIYNSIFFIVIPKTKTVNLLLSEKTSECIIFPINRINNIPNTYSHVSGKIIKQIKSGNILIPSL